MLQYKAGYKFVDGGVHAQVLDFPAAISCGANLNDARRMLGLALVDVAETLLGLGQGLPRPDSAVSDPEMVCVQFSAVVAYVIPAGAPPPQVPHVELPFKQVVALAIPAPSSPDGTVPFTKSAFTASPLST